MRRVGGPVPGVPGDREIRASSLSMGPPNLASRDMFIDGTLWPVWVGAHSGLAREAGAEKNMFVLSYHNRRKDRQRAGRGQWVNLSL